MPSLDVFWETWFPIIFWRGGRRALICTNNFIASKNFDAPTCKSTTNYSFAQQKTHPGPSSWSTAQNHSPDHPHFPDPHEGKIIPTHPSIFTHPSWNRRVRSPSWFLRCVDHISSASPESHSTPLLERAPYNLEDLSRERYRRNTTPEDDPRPAKWALQGTFWIG